MLVPKFRVPKTYLLSSTSFVSLSFKGSERNDSLFSNDSFSTMLGNSWVSWAIFIYYCADSCIALKSSKIYSSSFVPESSWRFFEEECLVDLLAVLESFPDALFYEEYFCLWEPVEAGETSYPDRKIITWGLAVPLILWDFCSSGTVYWVGPYLLGVTSLLLGVALLVLFLFARGRRV